MINKNSKNNKLIINATLKMLLKLNKYNLQFYLKNIITKLEDIVSVLVK